MRRDVHGPFVCFVDQEEADGEIEVGDGVVVGSGGGVEGVRTWVVSDICLGGWRIVYHSRNKLLADCSVESAFSFQTGRFEGRTSHPLPSFIFLQRFECVRFSVRMLREPHVFRYAVDEADHVVFPIQPHQLSPLAHAATSCIKPSLRQE